MSQHLSQSHSTTTVSRKARFWPEIPHEKISLPSPPSQTNSTSITSLVTIFFSLAGISIYAVVISRSEGRNGGGLYLGFMVIMGFMALGSLVSFFIQSATNRKKARYLLKAYAQRLQEIEQKLQVWQLQECQARIDLDPPLVLSETLPEYYGFITIEPLHQRKLDNQSIYLWARRPDDPDFLAVRIGMGERESTFELQGGQTEQTIAPLTRFEKSKEYARMLKEYYTSLTAPVTISLEGFGPVSITSNTRSLAQARNLARNMVAQLAYHHSPDDVRIIILAPHSQKSAWHWATLLPHTRYYDPRQSERENEELENSHAVAIGTGAVVEQLPLISRELGRRELLWEDGQHGKKTKLLPRLIIVVDHFDFGDDLDQPTVMLPAFKPGQPGPQVTHPRLSISPLKRGEMTLALSRGNELGVSVLCLNADKADVPATAGLVVDLDAASDPLLLRSSPSLGIVQASLKATQQKAKRRGIDNPELAAKLAAKIVQPRAYIRTLKPEPPPLIPCTQLDSAPLEVLHNFATRLQSLRPANTKRLEIRTQVDIRELFEPTLDLNHYNPLACWGSAEFRSFASGKGSASHLRIPIGMKIGDEVQYLDLLKDGPHGLLIGQTGSGKSELLQTIISAMAVTYRPTEVVFLLIDYKAGLALEPFRQLPHTVGFLSNVSSAALIQRFITMLRAEATKREVQLKAGKPMPRLIIIIDEFAEMAKRTEAVLEELFTITRVGREIGMHLLLSAQRPEGIIGSKVRDYVQYRLCLRCASAIDSREVLGRVDAANLPASIPGRGYLLHGDNQLDLFQAARVALPAHV